MTESDVGMRTVDACLRWLTATVLEADPPADFHEVLQAIRQATRARHGWLISRHAAVPDAASSTDVDACSPPVLAQRHLPVLEAGETVAISAGFIGGTVALPLRSRAGLVGIIVLAWQGITERPVDSQLHQLVIGLRQATEQLLPASRQAPTQLQLPGLHYWHWRRDKQTFCRREQQAGNREPEPLRQMSGADRARLRELLRSAEPGDLIDRRFPLAVTTGRGHARWQGIASVAGADGIVTVEHDAAAAASGPLADDLEGADELLVQRFTRVEGVWAPASVSRGLAALLGRESESLQEPGTLESLVHRDDLAALMRARRSLQPGNSYSSRYRMRDGRNGWLYLAEQGLCRQRADGAEYLVAVDTDLSDEVDAREALRDGEARFRGLLDDAPAMICRYRADYTIIFVNRACAEHFGQTPEAMLGKSWRDFLPAPARELHLRRLSELSETDPVAHYEIIESLPDQRRRWYVWTDRGFFSSHGLLEEVQSVGHDNTSLREAQEQLIQAGKMAALGVMATGVAHELNQPLNVMRLTIRNMRSRMERGDVDPRKVIDKLDRMDEQVLRASGIVDNIRRFGRVSGREPVAFDLNAAVNEAVQMVEPELQRQGIALDLRLSQEVGEVYGHIDQLEQVLINLMVNARDAIMGAASEAPGRVQIATAIAADGMREIRIVDSGGGIPEALLPRIFEPFFTTKDVGKGTGLGLSISFGMINDMGGRLSVRNVDRGAEFLVELPATKQSDDGGASP